MAFQLRPCIYALLLCASIRQDEELGGWIIQPYSQIAVQRLPVELPLTIFAQIMAPPGKYELELRVFHATDPDKTYQKLPTRDFTVQEGKNVDFLLHVEARFNQLGLYVVEATIEDHHTAVTPLRLSAPAT